MPEDIAESTPQAQLQAMRQLTENWDGYGAAPPKAHVLDLAREFVGLIEALLQKRDVDPTRCMLRRDGQALSSSNGKTASWNMKSRSIQTSRSHFSTITR